MTSAQLHRIEERMEPGPAEQTYELDRCIEGGCCVTGCGTARMREGFVGVVGMNRVARFRLDPRDIPATRAQGLGGLRTGLDIKIRDYPTHAASLPVAMIPNCAATRHMDGAAHLDPPDLSRRPQVRSPGFHLATSAGVSVSRFAGVPRSIAPNACRSAEIPLVLA